MMTVVTKIVVHDKSANNLSQSQSIITEILDLQKYFHDYESGNLDAEAIKKKYKTTFEKFKGFFICF